MERDDEGFVPQKPAEEAADTLNSEKDTFQHQEEEESLHPETRVTFDEPSSLERATSDLGDMQKIQNSESESMRVSRRISRRDIRLEVQSAVEHQMIPESNQTKMSLSLKQHVIGQRASLSGMSRKSFFRPVMAPLRKPGSYVDPLEYVSKRKEKIRNLFKSRTYQVVLVTFMFLALFGKDLTTRFLPISTHLVCEFILLGIFLFFATELCLRVWSSPDYWNTFFFWMDFIGTFSMLADFTAIYHTFTSTIDDSNFTSVDGYDDSYSILSAGVLVRTGARTTRALRLLRLIRFARLMRMFRIMKVFNTYYNRKRLDGVTEEELNAFNLGIHLGDLLARRNVIMLVVILFALPQLEIHVTNEAIPQQLEALQLLYENSNISHDLSHSVEDSEAVFVVPADKMTDNFSREFLIVYDNLIKSNENILQIGFYTDILHVQSIELIKEYHSFLEAFQTKNKQSYAIITDYEDERIEAGYNILVALLMILVLVLSGYLFTKDVNATIVAPIVRTTKAVKQLAKTLFILTADEENDDVPSLEQGFVDSVVHQLTVFFTTNNNDKKNPSRRKKVDPASAIESPAIVRNQSKRQIKAPASPREYIKNERVTCLNSLQECLDDSQALQFFKVFLTAEFAVESLLFIKKIDGYKELWLEIDTFVNQLISEFIATSALNQVNLSGPQRDSIVNIPNGHFTRTSFDEARLEIYNQLARDNFARFKQSPLAADLIQLKKRRLKEYQLMKAFNEVEF